MNAPLLQFEERTNRIASRCEVVALSGAQLILAALWTLASRTGVPGATTTELLGFHCGPFLAWFFELKMLEAEASFGFVAATLFIISEMAFLRTSRVRFAIATLACMAGWYFSALLVVARID